MLMNYFRVTEYLCNVYKPQIKQFYDTHYFGHLTDDHFSPSPTATQNCTCAIGEENEDSMNRIDDFHTCIYKID